MIEDWFRGRRDQLRWQVIGIAGALCGIIAPLLLSLARKPAGLGLPVAIGIAPLWLGVAGMTVFWMARLPEGLKGWRLGLILIPVVGWVWLGLEWLGLSWRLPRHITIWRRLLLILLTMAASLAGTVGCLAGGALWLFDPEPQSWAGVWCVAMLLWLVCFALMGLSLDLGVETLPANPVAVARRRRQLIAVLVIGWLPWIAYALWMGWECGRCRQLEAAWRQEIADAAEKSVQPPDPDPFFATAASRSSKPLLGRVADDEDFLKTVAPQLAEAGAFADQFTPWLESEAPGRSDNIPLDIWLAGYYRESGRYAILSGDREAFLTAWDRLLLLAHLDYAELGAARLALSYLFRKLSEASCLDFLDGGRLAEAAGFFEEAEEQEIRMYGHNLLEVMEYFIPMPVAEFSYYGYSSGVRYFDWRTQEFWPWVKKLRADAMANLLADYRQSACDRPEWIPPPSRWTPPMVSALDDELKKAWLEQRDIMDQRIEGYRASRVRIALELYRRRQGRLPENRDEIGIVLPPSRLYGTSPHWDADGTVRYPEARQ